MLFAAVMLCVPLRAAGQAAFEGIVPVELLAADGVRVAAELYPALAGERAVALLFHQAGSNAAEYAPIAGRLRRLGITCLAIDQRSGGRMWGRQNRTVARLGASATFWEAYADLEAALSWAATHHPGKPLLAWGSSYTAALVLRLAAEHPGELTAVLSFSPGEYFGPGEPVRAWAERVRQPLFVTSAPGSEVAVAKRIFEAAPARLKRQFVPASGVHGASILREDRNPGATGPVWAAVEKFLAEVLGAAPAASSSGPPRNARGEHGCASE
ncbi:MAG: alpha/beta hydrolase [Candidatus Dadabacteria bacterium]|nr:MAG: alpha/beta hydrolase [Candidatus Dadabacteria bacterium]